MSEPELCPFCGQSDDLCEVEYRKNYGWNRPYPYDSCVENLPVCVGCDDEAVCNPVITKRMLCSYCGVVVSDIEIWNTRPIEDALRAENERLKAENERLAEALEAIEMHTNEYIDKGANYPEYLDEIIKTIKALKGGE